MSAGCVAHFSFETIHSVFRVCALVYCSSSALFAKPHKIYKAFYRPFLKLSGIGQLNMALIYKEMHLEKKQLLVMISHSCEYKAEIHNISFSSSLPEH